MPSRDHAAAWTVRLGDGTEESHRRMAAGLGEMWPYTHELFETDGSSTLLFQYNPRNGMLQATSAFRLDELRTDPWQPSPAEAALIDHAFERRMPVFVTAGDRLMPDLASRLNTRSVEGVY